MLRWQRLHPQVQREQSNGVRETLDIKRVFANQQRLKMEQPANEDAFDRRDHPLAVMK